MQEPCLLKMNPPSRGEAIEIVEEGREKYGWHWMKDERGYWWGARSTSDHILQVEVTPPEFPTRRWNPTDGPGYTPMPQWEPLRMLVE